MKACTRARQALRPHPLTVASAQAYAHQSTVAVERRRLLCQFQRGQADAAIERLLSALAGQRRLIRELDARIAGLALVIERR